MNKTFKILLIIIVILFLWVFLRFVGGGLEDSWICVDSEWIKHGTPADPKPANGCGDEIITNFEECLLAGNPVIESYPSQCRTKDGQNFTEDIGNEMAKMDLIRINSPRPNQKISSPLEITGQARGYWFFEGSFPIKLYDVDGNLIVASFATAQGEWMTEDMVPFSAKLEFITPQTGKGLLILEKDNPSGLPENDDQLKVPVVFDGN